MNPNRTQQRRHTIAAAAVLIALLLPIVAAAIDCPVSTLPRPTEDHATIRARLEAQDIRHVLVPDQQPPLGQHATRLGAGLVDLLFSRGHYEPLKPPVANSPNRSVPGVLPPLEQSLPG